jgi:hypothetical protein
MSYGPDVDREIFYEMRRRQQGSRTPPRPALHDVLLLASLGASLRPRLAKRQRQLAALTRRLEQTP